ncbi:MAG: ABC transporter permease [Gemmatimonadota bacterium]|nr:MAG: ABC transporter permease [Gemmatimonadota bacterium]
MANRGTAELTIDAGRRAGLLQGLRELWWFRTLVLAFAERDVRVKYKQAVLGFAWAVLQPLGFLAVFSLFFGRVARISGDGVPYSAFALSALVPWLFLQTAVMQGAQSLLTDAGLVRKVYFPREVPVLGAVLSAGLDFVIAFGLLLALGPALGMHLSLMTALAIPLWLALALLASGVALAVGALNVYYRDFRYALPFLIQLWMFGSPVVYPLSAVPAGWRPYYVTLNPAAGLLDGFRHVTALGSLPDWNVTAVAVAVSALVALLGYWLFKRIEPGFADAI